MKTNQIFSLKGKGYQLWSPLFLRLVMGMGFLLHGFAKLQRGPEAFAKLLIFLNAPMPHFTAWLVTLTEIIGGIALITGLWVSFFSVPLAITMIVAMVTIHIHYGFSAVKTIGINSQGPLFGPPGYEINLVYIAGLLSLIFTGAGIFSLDAWIVRRASIRKAE